MVPPGASFEFYEGPDFRARTRNQKDLIKTVYAEVRARFDQFEKIDEDLRVGSVPFAGTTFGFLVQRLPRARMSLKMIWKELDEALDRKTLKVVLLPGRKP